MGMSLTLLFQYFTVLQNMPKLFFQEKAQPFCLMSHFYYWPQDMVFLRITLKKDLPMYRKAIPMFHMFYCIASFCSDADVDEADW